MYCIYPIQYVQYNKPYVFIICIYYTMDALQWFKSKPHTYIFASYMHVQTWKILYENHLYHILYTHISHTHIFTDWQNYLVASMARNSFLKKMCDLKILVFDSKSQRPGIPLHAMRMENWISSLKWGLSKKKIKNCCFIELWWDLSRSILLYLLG